MLSPTGADGAVAALFPVRKTQYAVAYARLCELRRFLIYPSASAFIAGDQIIVIAAPILAPFRNRPALMMKQQECIVVLDPRLSRTHGRTHFCRFQPDGWPRAGFHSLISDPKEHFLEMRREYSPICQRASNSQEVRP